MSYNTTEIDKEISYVRGCLDRLEVELSAKGEERALCLVHNAKAAIGKIDNLRNDPLNILREVDLWDGPSLGGFHGD